MDWLRRAAGERPEAPAVVTGDRTISYAELDRAADGAASIVCGGGMEGLPVALWGDRSMDTVAALWGILRARGTPVLVDPALPAEEQRRRTRLAGARGLWSPPEGGPDRLLARGSFRPPGDGFPAPGARMIVFTSGSRGAAKAVVLTGANVAASVAGSLDRLGNGPDDRWLCTLPLHHVGGVAILWRQAEQAAPAVLEERFDPGRVAAVLATVSYSSLVPTMLRRVLDAGPKPGATVLVGGGPVAVPLLRRSLDSGILALQTYGMTETASQVCTVAPGRVDEEMGTAGRPIAGAEVRVVSGGGVVVGEEGRVEVRGDMVSPGAVGESPRDPRAWFPTGDVGVVDAAGRLTVMGRVDSVIVSGGENVHPAAIQGVLESHPGVRGARVYGVADEEWGRRVVAEVVADGTDPTDLLRWASDRLHPAQVPKEIRVVESIRGKLEA